MACQERRYSAVAGAAGITLLLILRHGKTFPARDWSRQKNQALGRCITTSTNTSGLALLTQTRGSGFLECQGFPTAIRIRFVGTSPSASALAASFQDENATPSG